MAKQPTKTVSSSRQKQEKEKIKLAQSELDEVKGFLSEDEYEIVEDETGNFNSSSKRTAARKDSHPIQNTIVFIFSGFCIATILGASEIVKNNVLVIVIAAVCSLLLIFFRKRFDLKLWFPAKLSLLVFVGYLLFDTLKY